MRNETFTFNYRLSLYEACYGCLIAIGNLYILAREKTASREDVQRELNVLWAFWLDLQPVAMGNDYNTLFDVAERDKHLADLLRPDGNAKAPPLCVSRRAPCSDRTSASISTWTEPTAGCSPLRRFYKLSPRTMRRNCEIVAVEPGSYAGSSVLRCRWHRCGALPTAIAEHN